jgi:hypothetical protein
MVSGLVPLVLLLAAGHADASAVAPVSAEVGDVDAQRVECLCRMQAGLEAPPLTGEDPWDPTHDVADLLDRRTMDRLGAMPDEGDPWAPGLHFRVAPSIALRLQIDQSDPWSPAGSSPEGHI